MISKNEAELASLAETLKRLGCPKEKATGMAEQLDKRARQLAKKQGRTHEEALAHLLTLMQTGWAAQGES